MEDSQREAMFRGWKSTKKWVKVKVEEVNRKLVDGETWIATANSKEEGVFSYNTIGTTKLEAIQRMQAYLVPKNYEISNMAELMGIVPPESTPYMSVEESMKPTKHTLPKQKPVRRTFLEWLRHVEVGRKKRDAYNQVCYLTNYGIVHPVHYIGESPYSINNRFP